MSKIDSIADHLRTCFAASPAIFALLGTLLLALSLAETPNADPDLFARVAVGRLIVESGSVPIYDPFAFTPKLERWIDHEWLAGLFFYHLTQLGSDRALMFAALAFIFLTAWFLALAQVSWQGTKNHASRLSPVWLLLALLDSRYLWSSIIRAQVFTYLFLALWLWIFARVLRGGSRWMLVLLPVTMVPWANAHGGFVVGLGLLAAVTGTFLVRAVLQGGVGHGVARSTPWIVTLLLAFIATGINPYGLVNYWEYILHATSMERTSITEWAPLAVFSHKALVTNVFIILILIGIFKQRRSVDPISCVLLVLSAYQAYRHERLGAIFLFIAATFGVPIMASGCEALISKLGTLRVPIARAAAIAAVGAIPILTIIIAIRLISPFSLSYTGYPVRALEWLWKSCATANEPKRLLVDFNNGSFALWRLYPKFLISIDGRYEEVYPDSTLALVTDALNLSSSTQSHSLLQVAPDTILHRADSELSPLANQGWIERYRDSQYVILAQSADCESNASNVITESIWHPRF